MSKVIRILGLNMFEPLKQIPEQYIGRKDSQESREHMTELLSWHKPIEPQFHETLILVGLHMFTRLTGLPFLDKHL